MRIYRAKIIYELVQDGPTESILEPNTAVTYVRDAIADNPVQEQHFIITMDPMGHPIARHLIALGPVEGALIHFRDIFRVLMGENAHCFTYVHNHPIVDEAKPSFSDKQAVQALIHLGICHRVCLYDAVITTAPDMQGRMNCYSFRKAGWLEMKDLNGNQYRTGPEEAKISIAPGYLPPSDPSAPVKMLASADENRPAIAERDGAALRDSIEGPLKDI